MVRRAAWQKAADRGDFTDGIISNGAQNTRTRSVSSICPDLELFMGFSLECLHSRPVRVSPLLAGSTVAAVNKARPAEQYDTEPDGCR